MLFSLKDFLYRYKIPHIACWIIVSLFMISANYDPRAPIGPQAASNFMLTTLAIPVCWMEYNWLVPHFLFRRKFFRFILLSLVLILVASGLNYIISLFVYHLLTGKSLFPSFNYFVSIFDMVVLVNIVAAGIGLGWKIISNRFQIEKQLHEVEKEKISTELNFLRSQVNPHFLFNVMNTIYFQIDQSNTQARSSVEKLSEMLRYQLYDCTTDKIDIAAEVEYIRNYVAMQTLRMEKGTDIQLDCDQSLTGFFIAPLLLLPVIENAFKHVSNFKKPGDNKIHIALNKKDSVFMLQVTNTFDAASDSPHIINSGGLGMQNLRRRLGLLYPNRHGFHFTKEKNIFDTTLSIQYHD